MTKESQEASNKNLKKHVKDLKEHCKQLDNKLIFISDKYQARLYRLEEYIKDPSLDEYSKISITAKAGCYRTLLTELKSL